MTPTKPKGILTIHAKRPELLPTLDGALEKLDLRTGGILAVRNQLSDTAWRIGRRLKKFDIVPEATSDRYRRVRLESELQVVGRILGVRTEDIEINIGLSDITKYHPAIFSIINSLKAQVESHDSRLNSDDLRTLFFVANLMLQNLPTVSESLGFAMVLHKIAELNVGQMDESDLVALESYLEFAQSEFLHELDNISRSLEHAVEDDNYADVASLMIHARHNCWINSDLLSDKCCTDLKATLAPITEKSGECRSKIATQINDTIAQLTSGSYAENWQSVESAFARANALAAHSNLGAALDIEEMIGHLNRTRMIAFAAFFAYGQPESESVDLSNLFPSLTSMLIRLQTEHRPNKSLRMLREFVQARELNEVIRMVHKYPCKELIVDAIKTLDFMLPTQSLAEHIARQDIWFLRAAWSEDHNTGLAAKILADWYIPAVLASLFEFPNDKWGNPLLSLGDSLRLGGQLRNISSESCSRILFAFDTVFPEHESLPFGFIVAVHADIMETYSRIPASVDEACQMVRELYTRNDSIAGVGHGRALQDAVEHVLALTSSDNARAFLANRYHQSKYFVPPNADGVAPEFLGTPVPEDDKLSGAKLKDKFEKEYKRIRARAEWKELDEHIGQLAMQVVEHIRKGKDRLLTGSGEYCALPKFVGEIAGLPKNMFCGERLDRYEKYLVCRRVVLFFAPTTSTADDLSPITGYAVAYQTGGVTLSTGRMQSFLSSIGLRYEIARDSDLERKQWVKSEEETWLKDVGRP